jgi:hypothetical protein
VLSSDAGVEVVAGEEEEVGGGGRNESLRCVTTGSAVT